MRARDAIVVGAGPNGLAAAIVLARAGLDVLVLEAGARAGGGARSEALTLDGFVHDVCSAVHPLAAGSPFFTTLPLPAHGLVWVHPEAALAHPLPDGTAVLLERSLATTAERLGGDGPGWTRLMRPLADRWTELAPDLLAPPRLPRHPLALARTALRALRPARALAEAAFAGDPARALFGGLAAHSVLPLERHASSAIALVLGAAGHAVGWPFPRGGAQRLADALVSCLGELGAEVRTGVRVTELDRLPPARAILLDLTPRQFLRLAARRLPGRYRRRLERWRYGPGVFKLDWALDGPVPWRAPACARAGVVHLGGPLEEMRDALRAPHEGRVAGRPFVLLAQPSRFDPTRAPAGRESVWAYAHVPHAWPGDLSEAIEAQVERFAPGFRDRILARSALSTARLEEHDENLVGGDVTGGAMDLAQLIARPVPGLRPYRTPLPGVYLCSASTPPGAGVHGMCGYHAARTALRLSFGRREA